MPSSSHGSCSSIAGGHHIIHSACSGACSHPPIANDVVDHDLSLDLGAGVLGTRIGTGASGTFGATKSSIASFRDDRILGSGLGNSFRDAFDVSR